MKQDHSYRNILRVAFPLFISFFGQNIVSVTDTAFLGRVGEIELGAVGNAGLFYLLFILIAMGFSNGLQIIIGRRNGEQDFSAIGKLLHQGVYFSIPLMLIFFIVLNQYSEDLLGNIVQSESIKNRATEFLKVRSYGIPFAIINLLFTAFFVGITQTRILSLATTIMSISNVILDYALIFGKFGLPEMGHEGAALASVISEVINIIVLIVYTVLFVEHKKYGLLHISGFEKERLIRVLRTSYPMMIQNFLSFGSWFVFFTIIEHLGERELAVSHIVRSLYMMIMMPVFSLSNATNTLVSNLIGQGESDNVLSLIGKSILLGFIANAVIGIFIWIFPEAILSIFTDNQLLIKDSIGTLYVVSIAMFFFTGAILQFTGVTGTGNTTHALTIEFINIIIYLTVAYFAVKVLVLPLELVWCSEFVYFTLLGVMSYFYLKSGVWKGKKI